VVVRRTSVLLIGLFILLTTVTARAEGNIVWTMTTGPTGGFVSALALAPNAPGILYAGSNSGVYLTRDDGARWYLVAKGLPDDPTTTALAVTRDPSTVLAGTFSGIYRTRDAGANWTAADPRLANQTIHAFLGEPQNPNLIYAATATTVLRSENGGDTWTDVGADLKSVRVWTLAHADASVLYAATDAGIFVSRDRGAHWQSSSEGLPDGARPQSIVVTARGFLAGTTQGIYRSRDGKNWSAIGGSLTSGRAEALLKLPPIALQFLPSRLR